VGNNGVPKLVATAGDESGRGGGVITKIQRNTAFWQIPQVNADVEAVLRYLFVIVNSA
jgi:hypothetical protein